MLLTGEKLIEHLTKWLYPEQYLLSGDKAWQPGQEAQVASTMLGLFHLLPAQASRCDRTYQGTYRAGVVPVLAHCFCC